MSPLDEVGFCGDERLVRHAPSGIQRRVKQSESHHANRIRLFVL